MYSTLPKLSAQPCSSQVLFRSHLTVVINAKFVLYEYNSYERHGTLLKSVQPKVGDTLRLKCAFTGILLAGMHLLIFDAGRYGRTDDQFQFPSTVKWYESSIFVVIRSNV